MPFVLCCHPTPILTCDLRASQRLVNFFPQDDNTDTGIEFWERDDSYSFLYVDDTTLLNSVPLNEAERHLTTGTTVEEFWQLAAAGDFDELSRRVEDIGMAINGKKTQLLVISPPYGCLTSASIATADDHDIKSVEKLKLVGFTFGSSRKPMLRRCVTSTNGRSGYYTTSGRPEFGGSSSTSFIAAT